MADLLDAMGKKKSATVLAFAVALLALQVLGKVIDRVIPDAESPAEIEHRLVADRMCEDFLDVPHDHGTQNSALISILARQEEARLAAAQESREQREAHQELAKALREITVTQIQIQASMEQR
jgi:hypothetical protein